MSGCVTQSKIDEDVIEVEIDNAARLNALTVRMWHELSDIFHRISSSEGTRCVVVKGAGLRAFSAGADISEFKTTRATRADVEAYHENIVGPCLRAIAECPVPVVASIRGVCMGGGLEIAAACDMRLGDCTTRMGAPVGRLGFPLAFGESQLLFNLVGYITCAEILIEGRVYDAQEAYERRLLNRVSDVDSLAANVRDAVAAILGSGPTATKLHKAQLRRLMADHSPVTYEERRDCYSFADTDEYRNGVRSFLERSNRGADPS